jgi:hypothetical protein
MQAVSPPRATSDANAFDANRDAMIHLFLKRVRSESMAAVSKGRAADGCEVSAQNADLQRVRCRSRPPLWAAGRPAWALRARARSLGHG